MVYRARNELTELLLARSPLPAAGMYSADTVCAFFRHVQIVRVARPCASSGTGAPDLRPSTKNCTEPSARPLPAIGETVAVSVTALKKKKCLFPVVARTVVDVIDVRNRWLVR